MARVSPASQPLAQRPEKFKDKNLEKSRGELRSARFCRRFFPLPLESGLSVVLHLVQPGGPIPRGSRGYGRPAITPPISVCSSTYLSKTTNNDTDKPPAPKGTAATGVTAYSRSRCSALVAAVTRSRKQRLPRAAAKPLPLAVRGGRGQAPRNDRRARERQDTPPPLVEECVKNSRLNPRQRGDILAIEVTHRSSWSLAQVHAQTGNERRDDKRG
jgi:hypothetical protein